MNHRRPPIAGLPVVLALLLFASTSARAEEGESTEAGHVEQRLVATASLAPFATISSLGGDGHMSDAKGDLLGLGAGLAYGLRPLRHLELGVGVDYAYFHEHAAYAHEFRAPFHVGLVLPVSRRFELLLAARVGYTHLWLPHQGYVEGGGSVLHASGLAVGPWIAGFFSVGRGIDIFAGLEGVFRAMKLTNGGDYLRDVPVVGLSVPIEVGVRARW